MIHNHNNTHSHHTHHKKHRGLFGKLIKNCFIISVILFLAFILYVGALAIYLPDPTKLTDRQIQQSTKIYDSKGETILYEIFSEKKRTNITLDSLPSYVVDATLSIEDKNFYNHKGIAWKSIVRALISNILGRQSGKGGASTLTQQLIKNAIVGNERNFTRKIKEAVLAWRVEQKFSKKEILEMYFNEIPYGSTNYGIEAASQDYFGKNAKDISLAEAATLAALTQAPTRYLNNLELLTTRRNYVLELMKEQGRITESDAEKTKKEKIELTQKLGDIFAPHFVLMVKEQLTETLGEKLVAEGGLKVITTLDVEKQKIAEDEIKKGVEFNRKNYNAQNAAFVALDVKTGHIIAMVGSRNFFDKEYDGQVNVVLRPRQPGSSFKPLVYLAAFIKGYTPETILYDVVTNFKTDFSDYTPHNYNLKELGPVTIRKALQGSLNIPAVKVLYLVGIDNILSLAKEFGYSTLTDRSRFGLSLVLGGGEVTLLEHTATYATFAREGLYLPPVSILRIENNNGKVIYEYKQPEGKLVADRNSVLTLTNVLSDNSSRAYVFGENSPLQLGQRPVAAKTGTTNDYRDGWLLGYSPSLAAGVWAGNNDNSPMNKAGGSLAGGAIWNGFMRRALENTPIEQFTVPEKTKTTKPALIGKNSGEIEVEIDTVSGKLATEYTPQETRLKKKYFAGHSILFWINKDDPTGDQPTNPETDPQFERWESAIRKWAEKNGSIIEQPPFEYDDIHKPELAPKVSFITPQQGETIGRKILVSVNATAPHGVARVRYFVDNIQMAESSNEYDFNTTISLGSFENGFHTITARAFDSSWNSGSASIDINLTGDAEPPTAVWQFPPQGSSITALDFPLGLSTRFTMIKRIKTIDLVMQKPNNETSIIYSAIQPPNPLLVNLEKSDGNGVYKFFWQITYDNDLQTTSPTLILNIGN